MDELWNIFTQSGKIEDYLNYRKQTEEKDNADEDKGLNYQGTDYRGE